MTIDKAIELLKAYYYAALENPFVEKKISWALYQTWKDVDAKEKKEKRRSDNG